MIRLKQLIEQAGVNPVDKKTAKDSFKNIKKTAKWEPIVGQFSKQFKEYITRPQELIQLNGLKGLFSGFKHTKGTLQNGGDVIFYKKHPTLFNKGADDYSKEIVPDFEVSLQPNYTSKYNPNYFMIHGNILIFGNPKTLEPVLKTGGVKGEIPGIGGLITYYAMPFYIGLYLDKSGKLTYGVAPGAAYTQTGLDPIFGTKSMLKANPENLGLLRSGNIATIDQLVSKIESFFYTIVKKHGDLDLLIPISTNAITGAEKVVKNKLKRKK